MKPVQTDFCYVPREWSTIPQVADLLGFHAQTIRNWVRSGRLKARKFGRCWRVQRVDLESFIEGRDDRGEDDHEG